MSDNDPGKGLLEHALGGDGPIHFVLRLVLLVAFGGAVFVGMFLLLEALGVGSGGSGS